MLTTGSFSSRFARWRSSARQVPLRSSNLVARQSRVCPGDAGGRCRTDLPEGWLWDDRPIPLTPADTRRQVWVMDLSRDELRLIHETTGYVTQPAWSATADSLAWVEFSLDPPDADANNSHRLPGKVELVRHFRDGRRDILHSESGVWPRSLVEELPSKSTAWSPDGKFIAFSWVGSSSLRVLELSTRGLVAEWPAADFPSWSPTGQWLAYFDRSLDRGIRVVAAGSWGSPTKAVRVTSVSQPVVWESMGDSFLLCRPISVPALRAELGIPRRVPQVRRVLARVHVPDMSVESIGPPAGPKQRDVEPIAWSLAYHEPSEKVLLAGVMENTPPGFDVIDLRSTSPTEPSPQEEPTSGQFDESIAEDWGIGGLSLSPDGRRLAFRYGPNDPYAPTGIYDSQTKRLQTIAATMAVRMRALRILTMLIAQGLGRPDKEVGVPWTGVRPAMEAAGYAELGVRPKSPLALFKMPAGPDNKTRPLPKNIHTMIDEARSLVQQAPPSRPRPHSPVVLRKSNASSSTRTRTTPPCSRRPTRWFRLPVKSFRWTINIRFASSAFSRWCHSEERRRRFGKPGNWQARSRRKSSRKRPLHEPPANRPSG